MTTFEERLAEQRRERLAWAAGLFDGEGTVTIRRSKPTVRKRKVYPAPTLAVYQAGNDVVAPDVLVKFKEAIGFGCVRRQSSGKPNGWRQKPMWIYVVQSFAEVQAVCAMLWPWLGDVKHEQIRRTLLAMKAYYSEPDPPRREDYATDGRWRMALSAYNHHWMGRK